MRLSKISSKAQILPADQASIKMVAATKISALNFKWTEFKKKKKEKKEEENPKSYWRVWADAAGFPGCPRSFLSGPRTVQPTAALCSRLQTDIWWLRCRTAGRSFVSRGFAACPALPTHRPGFYATRIWQALGTAKFLHLQVIPRQSLALLVRFGAQQPCCRSINSERCLLWS